MILSEFHPIMQHYFIRYMKWREELGCIPGMMIGPFNEFTSKTAYIDLVGQAIFSSCITTIVAPKKIRSEGTLMTGQMIALRAPEIILENTILVALGDLNLEAVDLTLRNVTIYLFQSNFTYFATRSLVMENITIVVIARQNQCYIEAEVIENYGERPLEDQMEELELQIRNDLGLMEEQMEELELQIRNDLGLRSLLA